MTRTPALTLVTDAPETPARDTYATIAPEALAEFATLEARISRIRTALSGRFTTSTAKERAIQELSDVPALAISVQRYLRRGR